MTGDNKGNSKSFCHVQRLRNVSVSFFFCAACLLMSVHYHSRQRAIVTPPWSHNTIEHPVIWKIQSGRVLYFFIYLFGVVALGRHGNKEPDMASVQKYGRGEQNCSPQKLSQFQLWVMSGCLVSLPFFSLFFCGFLNPREKQMTHTQPSNQSS